MKNVKIAVVVSMLVGVGIAVGCTGGPGGDIQTPDNPGPNPGTPDAGPPPTCSDGVFKGERICVPGTARANVPLTLQAMGTEGCTGCGTTVKGCKVDVADKKITVTIEKRSCTVSGACGEACGLPQTSCAIPGLAAGTYRLDFGGGADAPKGRELVVADDATTASCTFPSASVDIDADDFPKSCTPGDDSTCALISEGSACDPCRQCPTGAVAKSAVPAVDAKYREQRAACTGDVSGPACAACLATHKAVCNVGGQCEAQPL